VVGRADRELGAALGAARLAQLAAEPGASVAAVCAAPAVAAVVEPDSAWQAALAPRLARFRALYPPLRPLFRPEETAP
jgi:xylulokinase